ncbi:hypothetical protein BDM02DRAFT_3122499 [Thelephora ganbajun]|uniref:Uncharacterized protein n=1 Tax=Thelephora ganbajun TaxID=370292 RepID=A0ACB6Z328_THEGA|nr:hypothetical protein BDM02DRAFT_3122499 [Thelephora ganbajun]
MPISIRPTFTASLASTGVVLEARPRPVDVGISLVYRSAPQGWYVWGVGVARRDGVCDAGPPFEPFGPPGVPLTP